MGCYIRIGVITKCVSDLQALEEKRSPHLRVPAGTAIEVRDAASLTELVNTKTIKEKSIMVVFRRVTVVCG